MPYRNRQARARAAFAASGGFLPVLGAALGAAIESNTVTLRDIGSGVALTISGGAYSKNGGAYSTASTTISDGDTLKVRVTAPNTNSASASAVVSINGNARTFSVTTVALTPAVLGPTTASFTAGAASATVIAAITGLSSGETLSSVTPNDGRLAVSSGNLVVGLTASSAGSIAATITTSTGRTLDIAVTVNAGAISGFGPVGNNNRIMNAGNAGAQQFNARVGQIATQDITRIRVDVSNWFWWSNNQTDTNNGYSQTWEMAVEYPVGTFQRLLYNGANTGTMSAASDDLGTDYLTLSSPIPAGAAYFIRAHMETADGWYSHVREASPGVTYPALVASLEYGATVTNKVMGGTISQTSSTVAWFPLAVVADNVTKPTILIVGSDSIGRGANDDYDTSTFNHGYLERAIGNKFGVLNAGSYGDTASNFVSAGKSTKRQALKRYCTHVISQDGCNDVNGSNSASTIISNLTTVLSYFSDKKVYRTTLTPRSTSTDSWATAENQTVGTNFVPSGKLDTVNAAIRSGLAGSLGVFDPLSGAFDTTTNKWLVDGTANKYVADGVHPSPFASSAMAAQIAAQVQALDGGTPVTDTTPNAFTFTDVTGAPVSTVTESNAITVSGINAPAPISVTGGEYQINGGSWVTTSGTVTNGQTVKVRGTSSASNATTTNVVLTIGGVSDTYSITTVAASQALAISGSPAPASVGSSTAFTPTITGGTSPYTLSLLSGTLPPGRALSGNSVTGTYTTAGSYSYTLRATDNVGATADLPVSMTVAATTNSLLTRTATLAAWDASDRTSMFQDTAGTTVVTGSGQTVGRMNDKRGVNNYHLIAPSDAARPLSTGGLTFDGTDDSLNFAFASTGPTLGTMVYLIKTTDTKGSIGNNTNATTAFHGAFSSGDTGASQFGTNSGNIRYAKDGVALSGINRNTLFTNICDGVAHVLEVNTITMTQYVGMAIAFSRYDATFIAQGIIIPVALLDQNAADYTDALTDARAFANQIKTALGI